MSVEIILYTKNATKTGLTKFLLENGFQKTKHFIEEANNENSLHYIWYEFNNYQSSTGVEASIQKVAIEEQSNLKSSEWILHTRTRSSGSFEDKQKQNEIIRKARKQFGGTFYNDWYGTNKYINLDDYPQFSPLEKSLSIISNNSIDKIEKLRDCLEGYQNKTSDLISNIQYDFIKALIKNNDPSIILYNSLIPFLVSVIEYFFSQSFSSHLKYDTNCKEIIANEKIKIDMSEVLNITNNINSIEAIVTKYYNFQNIESINRAYKKYLNIDIRSVLSCKKKINSKIFRVITKLDEILNARHSFVHELDINYDITKDLYFSYLKTIEVIIELMLVEFKNKGLKIEYNKY
ncbi:hypothetical protein [Chryseobacterium gleum]|uniref:hypothetical protein n=1 Tax=Chryseobacterium gleum TaxID=250 RepID=UPI00241CDD95|nr:hypothetical protein [Chryseobacterium gleum]